MTFTYDPRGHRISTAGVQNIDEVLRRYRDSAAGEGQPGLTSGYPPNYVCFADGDIDPDASGDVYLLESIEVAGGSDIGIRDPSTKDVFKMTDVYNLTRTRVWGPAGADEGAKCVISWVAAIGTKGGWAIVATDAATRVRGTIDTGGTISLNNVVGIDGYFPMQSLTPSNVFQWSLVGSTIGSVVHAEWNQTSTTWEAYQMECIPPP